MSKEITSEAPKKEAKEITAVKEEKKPEKDFTCYVGPTILGVIQNGTIFDYAREKALKIVPEGKYPGIDKLFVSGKNLAQARIDVNTPGTLLYHTFRQLSGR